MKKQFFLIILLQTVLFLFGNDKIDLKIGFVGPLSGDLAEYGTPQLEAIRYSSRKYEDYFNIEIISLDDEGDPLRSKEAAQELLDQNIDYVIGHVTSAATSAALQIYNNRTLLLNPSSTSPFINNENQYSTFIRTIPNDFSQSERILDFVNHHNFKKVCIIYEYNDYAKNILSGINSHKNDQIFQNLILDLSDGRLYEDKNNTGRFNDFILETDLIVFIGYYAEFKGIYKFLRENVHYNGEILGSDGVCHSGLFEETDIDFTNTYALNAADMAETEEVADVLKNYSREHSQNPGIYFSGTYIANDMMLCYLSKNPELFSLNTEEKAISIANNFKNNPQESMIGPLSFNINGDIKRNSYRIYKVIDNEFVEY